MPGHVAFLVLDWVKIYLQNGTVVLFDDFYHYKGNPDQGEQKALREFCELHPDMQFMPWSNYAPVGKSFIVHREAA